MYRAVKFTQAYPSDGNVVSELHAERAQYLDHLSETDSAAQLKAIATQHGWAFKTHSVKVKSERSQRYGGQGGMLRTTRVIELAERGESLFYREPNGAPVYLAWVELPEIDALPPRVNVSDDVSEDEIENYRQNANDYDIGVGQFGDDEDGNAVIAVSSHAFWHIGPALGYSVAAMCAMYGGTEDSITFDDQVFYCQGCNTLQEDTDGYNYRFRIVDSEMFGIACGCAADAELEHLDTYVNEPEKQIQPDTAELLVKAGKLEHVARYIGGMVDPGRGGYYDGERVENGQPDDVLAQLLENEPDAEFVLSMDEAGQFQVYWSVYRVVQAVAA